MNWQQLILTILTSGLVSAITSALLAKRNERETRIFNAKFKAYNDLIGLLRTLYIEDFNLNKDASESLSTLNFRMELLSSPVILVAPKHIYDKLRELNKATEKIQKVIYDQMKKNKKKTLNISKEEMRVGKMYFELKDEVVELMRTDLGF